MRAIAYYTFLECVRNRVLLSVAVFFVVGVASLSFFRYLTPAEELKLLKDFCFGAINFIGIVTAIFLPVVVISREMEKLTIYVVLSKPVGRGTFICAKYAGIMMAMAAVMASMGALFLCIIYLRQGTFDPVILKSIALLLCKFSIMSAISICCVLMTTTHMLAAMISFSVYILGNLVDYLYELIARLDAAFSQAVLSVAVKLLPNLSGFDVSDAIVVGTAVGWGYIAKMAAYAALYTAAVIALSALYFRKKQL